MVQKEVALSHLQIILNLRSVSSLGFPVLHIQHVLVVRFGIIMLRSFSFMVHQIVFFGIDNIHAMRESLTRLRDYLDVHGTTSSDGMSSFLVSLHHNFKDTDTFSEL